MKTLKLWTACGLFLLMQACATAPERYQESALELGAANTQLAPGLDSLSQGDFVVFYTGILASFGQVMIGREYHSANGRVCKKILKIGSNDLLSVACKMNKESWVVRKPLQSAQSDASTQADRSNGFKKVNKSGAALQIPAQLQSSGF